MILKKNSKDEKEKLKKNIDDIINKTPRTQIASMYFKRMLTVMSKETAKGARDVINRIAVDQAKDAISSQMM